jgi:hypothetical protein
VQIEARPYDADMTGAERAAIAARVSLVDEGIVVWRELPVCTPASIRTMWAEAERLLAGCQPCVFVFDLREALPPDAPAREALRACAREMVKASGHFSVVLGDRFILGVISRLVAYAAGYHQSSFHRSVDAAIAEARRVLSA